MSFLSTGHLLRRLVGDCVTFDLNCLQSVGFIHVIWNKDNQRVAKIRQAANASTVYCSEPMCSPTAAWAVAPRSGGMRESMWQKYLISMACICIRKLLTWNWTVSLSVLCVVWWCIFSRWPCAVCMPWFVFGVFYRMVYFVKEWNIQRNFPTFFPFCSLSVAVLWDRSPEV